MKNRRKNKNKETKEERIDGLNKLKKRKESGRKRENSNVEWFMKKRNKNELIK